jgi:hypothetical protein
MLATHGRSVQRYCSILSLLGGGAVDGDSELDAELALSRSVSMAMEDEENSADSSAGGPFPGLAATHASAIAAA